MNYIDLLTQEEKPILCRIIAGRDFKELFKRNEQEFSKIRKGFRAKSLTEQQALSIAIVNVDKPFIAMWVNTRVDIWLKEIQENIEELEEEGSTHDIALASTMLDSVFANNVDLYLKLAGKTMDANARSKLHERMESIKSERARNAEVADRIKVLEEEKRHLLDQIAAAQQSVNTIKAEYERKMQELEQDKDTLESLLAEAQERITELQTAPTAAKSDDADYLSQFDDTDTSVLPSVDSDEIVSLCGVISDYNGQKWLIRHADLSHNGHYHIFRKSEDVPPYFTNRDKIFYKDGPSNDGFYGIWTWSATPNEKDPSKDYILSRYNMDLDAIEVVTISEASNLDNLINLLKNGIEYQPHSHRVMFAFYASKGQYMGILCNTQELNTVNGKTAFAEDCIEVPVYEFTGGNILRLDNGLSFYRNAFAGLPSKLYQLKSPLDIVKNIVFSSISWGTYKTRGLTRAEYRTFKDFLGSIPVDDITCKIETACRCSNSAAKELLDEFLNVVWKYVDGDSLEDEIILSAISASTELQERIKALIRTDWESLAEALRLVASKKLDVEFTELVTGYRLRTGAEASYVDIYLYDSLSSGAGYAVSVADAIAELLSDMKELLSSCDCGSACSKCLKHYRNQYVHGMLDRFAALQLLEWGVDGIKASPIKPETQINMIMPLANILKQSGCEITADSEITATGRRIKKKIVIYPAMWVEPHATNTIFVSDAYIKYAKPYAVQKILDNI